MTGKSLGFCGECKAKVPARYDLRDGGVWFKKFCPDCGTTESFISSDAVAWQQKRDLWQGAPERTRVQCSLHCDRCKTDHGPTTLFLDVTNHCNMDCPMCGFSLRGMGFEFNPPMQYFDKVLQKLSNLCPRPQVNLFGGEPTVRSDMFEIIRLGRSYGLDMRVATNGLRLADEQYCKELCKLKVGLRIGFDGRGREIYARLRNKPGAYEMKMKAFENLKKHSQRRHALFTCMATGINDQHMPDLMQFCHDNRDIIDEVGVLPLYENWKPGEFEVTQHTTLDDVEKVFRDAVPGGGVEFFPAGMLHWLAVMRPFFSTKPDLGLLKFAGVHPNCESLTFLISDGKSYRGLGHYLKRPLKEAAQEFGQIVQRIEPRLTRLNRDKRLHRLRAKLICLVALLPWLLRTVNLSRSVGGNLLTGPWTTLWRLWNRRRTKKRTGRPSPALYLRLAIIPLEEQHSIDSERLKSCRVGSPYEDVDTGRVEIIPHCVWYPYRNEILRKITEKYGTTKGSGKAKPAAKSLEVLKAG